MPLFLMEVKRKNKRSVPLKFSNNCTDKILYLRIQKKKKNQ